MSFTETIAHGALHLLATLYPKSAPFVAAIEKYGPTVAPIIINALHEGGSALAAAEKAAPGLTQSIKDLVSHTFVMDQTSHPDVPVENMLRTLVGFPHMTPEQEKVWMDRATPHNDPSEENSKFGG